MTQLDDAIAAIDRLVELLKEGKLLGSAGNAPVKPAAPTAAVPKAATPVQAKPTVAPSGSKQEGEQAKQPKQRKEKKEKAKAAPAAAAESEDPLAKAHLAVARVISVADHPSGSEKLLLCRIDAGEAGGERQVVAGLKQHISKEELQGRLVAVVLNLKPAKLAGELSQAMILAADTPQGDSALVRVLEVPASATPGTPLCMQGGAAPSSWPKECKSNVWKGIVEKLAVQGGKACYDGKPLVVSSNGGGIAAAGMPDGAGIH